MMNDSEKTKAESCEPQRNLNDEKDENKPNPARNNQIESSMENKLVKNKEEHPTPSQKLKFDDQEDTGDDDDSSKKCDSNHLLQEENQTDDTVSAVDEEGDGQNDNITNADNDNDDQNDNESDNDADDSENDEEGEVKNTISNLKVILW